MKKFCKLLIFLCSVIPGNAQHKLAIIGSSTSACYGFTSNNDNTNISYCYVNRLTNYYAGLGQPIELHNIALSGTNVYQGMPTGYPTITVNGQPYAPNPDHNITKALSFIPDVILVNYPSNQYDVMSVHDVLQYFRTIKAEGNLAGKRVFITTTQPRNYDQNGRNKLIELKDSILLQFGNYAINFWDGLANADGTIIPMYEQNPPDGIHLNNLGHDILFQRVRDKNIFSVALPVQLLSFSAKSANKEVFLEWKVAEESPTTTYQLQRSMDGVRFENIVHFVVNNSNAMKTYQYKDEPPGIGIFYYRLIIEENSLQLYSVIKKAIVSRKTAVEKIYVANGRLKVLLQSDEMNWMNFRIINTEGAIVRQFSKQVIPGENQIEFSTTSLPTDIYWIEVRTVNARIFLSSFIKK